MNQKKAGVILSYTSEAIKIVTGIVYTPVMIRLLGQSEYGLYQLTYSVVSYLSLFSLGFGSGYMRYYAKRKAQNDEEGIAKLNGLFFIVFVSLAFLAVICGCVLVINSAEILGDKLTFSERGKAKILMSLLVISLGVSFPDSIYNCIIIAHERFLFQKIIIIVSYIANPLITLPLLIAGYGSVAMVGVSTIITIGVFLTHIIYCHRKLKVRFCFKGIDWSLLKSLSKFTFFIFLNQIIDQINWSVDKFILGRVSGTTAISVYGVAAQLNTFYVTLSTAVSSVFVPQVNHLVANGDENQEVSKLFVRVGRVQYLILALACTGLIFGGSTFIPLWAGEEYSSAYSVMLFLIIPVTFPLVQNLGIEIQRAYNKHQVRSVVYFLIAISNVFISIPLASKYGPLGAAIGTAISLVSGNIIFMNFYYHYALKLDMVNFWKQIICMNRGLIIPFLVGSFYLFFVPHNLITFLLFVFIYTCIYLISMWFLGMNEYEKNLIQGMLHKKITKR